MSSLSVSRPKVCHLIHDGSGQGGGATFSLAYFPAYNVEFETFAITGQDGNLAEKLRARGVRTLTLPMARPWQALLSWPSLWNILYREQPDVVIVHGQWGGFFGSLATRAVGIHAVIYYTHFPSFYADWDLLRVVRNRLAESMTCWASSKIVCLSSAGRYQYLLRRLGPEEKFIHLTNGIDPTALTQTIDRATLNQELNLPAESHEPVVMSMGRLAYQKRIDWLLRGWAIVEAKRPKGHLVIIGDGPEEATLHRLARELKLERCHFLGSRPDGYRYFKAADFGVICSMFEGHPLALIEAMFLSCPMIGTAVDGISETIVDGTTGLLVPPADPPSLAKEILNLLDHPARRRQMGEAARLRAEEFYRRDKILPQQIQLVKDQLKNSSRPNRIPFL